MDTRASRPRTRSKGPALENVWYKKKRKSTQMEFEQQESIGTSEHTAEIQGDSSNIANTEMSTDQS